MAKRRRKPPEILKCERCGTMFTLKLPLCLCADGPCIEQWAKENGWSD